jgi:Glycosyl transferase family 2
VTLRWQHSALQIHNIRLDLSKGSGNSPRRLLGKASDTVELDLQELNLHKNRLADASWNDLTITREMSSLSISVGVSKARLAAESITSQTFEYWRVGYDKRRMTFLADGRVGEGAAGCEVFWRLEMVKGRVVLEISSGTEITCRLKQDSDGAWRGRWIHHEKMAVVLAPLRSGPRMRAEALQVVAVIAIRNEERYLAGYFKHVRDFVDGFVVFDDNSTDSSLSIVRAEPKVLALLRRISPSPPHYFEIDNRKSLLAKALELEASWVLCCDADERFERAFLKNLRNLTGGKSEQPVMALRLRALWNSPNQYRVDGIYADRHKYVLFRCPSVENYHAPHSLHAPWYPPSLNAKKCKRILDYNLYHLKSIRTEDRLTRYEKFRTIDPDARAQAEGYEHLVDEVGRVCERIPKGKEYDL